MTFSCFAWAVLWLGSTATMSAQGTGSLTGQVFCSDTQKPARFASVMLVPDVTEGETASYQGRRGFGASASATAADGTFLIKDVQAGVYDVQVMLPGYIQPIRQLNIYADSAASMKQTLLSMITKVTIRAGQTANATVTAYRGADLIGTILYDDGTPAAGITVSALLATTVTAASGADSGAFGNSPLRPIGSNAQTDDRGRFHLAALADGTYSIQAVPRSGTLFPVYLGNTIDRGKATVVAVKAGEERSGLEMTMNITDLHRVHGVLLNASNHGLSNASISLALADNAGAQLNTSTAADGSFSFAAVPDGKYTVSSGGGFDADARTTYRNVSTQVTVSGSDLTDVVRRHRSKSLPVTPVRSVIPSRASHRARSSNMATVSHPLSTQEQGAITADISPIDRDRLRQACEMLLEARRTTTPITSLPDGLRPRTVAEAYFLQDVMMEELGEIAGWKVGTSSPDTTPMFAPMFDFGVAKSGSLITTGMRRMRGVEAEIAYLLGKDLPPRSAAYSREEVIDAIASAHPAIELLESAFVDPDAVDRLSMVGDLQMHGGFVYGPAFAEWRNFDFAQENVTVAIDGVVRTDRGANGVGADILSLVEWLANHGQARTGGLRKGQWVTTGSWMGKTLADAGSAVHVHFDHFGDVRAEFEAHPPKHPRTEPVVHHGQG